MPASPASFVVRQPFADIDCPNAVTWTNDICKLFTDLDIQHMKVHNIDLSSIDSVRVWATHIFKEVSTGDMPPAGSGEAAWTQDMVNTFGCWIKQGMPE
ncbi:MAG: hypothetical protein WB764_20670 [Xanthobacteraceae bacterium]